MDAGGGSNADRDLLSRLNALKKSTVDFDQNTCDCPTVLL